jgi:hypothetical protein
MYMRLKNCDTDEVHQAFPQCCAESYLLYLLQNSYINKTVMKQILTN